MSLRLHELGWHNFQELAATIGRDVWGQMLQRFADTNDIGRDGAFYGVWTPQSAATDLAGNFVVQCKHFSNEGSHLTLTSLREDIAKVETLVKRGLCDHYLVITNGGLTGGNDAAIRAAVLGAGAKSCMCYGAEWIEGLVRENKRLRQLVPRLYGLGDLSEIIDERGYAQAEALLESLQYDIQTFVPTESYRRAVTALNDHGFVLLLGEPAAGKSVIASTLALISADTWGCRVIKADGPQAVVAHWNPNEPQQFFWIDDAFGATQYDASRSPNWNDVFSRMRAAIVKGARFVVTSRDYIWNAARNDLKLSSFPALEARQVVVDVARLTDDERRKILYNHVKMGNQPRSFKVAVKPYLHSVSENPRFLPEIARRLADPRFTSSLHVDALNVSRFVEKPEEFLVEVVEKLDRDSRAALILLTMSEGELPSPLSLTADQRQALRLLGSTESACRQAFVAMDGSLVRLIIDGEGRRSWAPRHPTITDAVITVLQRNPELVELYVRAAQVERLLREVTCGLPAERAVVVPPPLFTLVLERINEQLRAPRLSASLLTFITRRCSDAFLRLAVMSSPSLIERVLTPDAYLSDRVEVTLLRRLVSLGLLSNAHRETLAEHALLLALTVPDASFVSYGPLRDLLGPAEVSRMLAEVRGTLPRVAKEMFDEWRYQYDSSEDPADYLAPLISALDVLAEVIDDPDIAKLRSEAEALEDDLPADDDPEPEYDSDIVIGDAAEDDAGERDIFDDVDR